MGVFVAPHVAEGVGCVVCNARLVMDIDDVMGEDGLGPAHMDGSRFLSEEEVTECLAVGFYLNGCPKYVGGELV